MEDFTKLNCGCHVGFDVHHKPMWGKQCPLHESALDLYEALKGLEPTLVSLSNGTTITHPIMMGYAINALQALAKAEGK